MISGESMSVTGQIPKVIYADQEHSGIRIGVLTILFIGFPLAFILLNVRFGNASVGLLADFSIAFACLGALILALGLAAIGERLMKGVWHSGRKVMVEQQGLRAKLADEEEVTIRWSDRATAIRWYFQMSGYPKAGRERRVPNNHYCLACQVRQSGQFLIVYAFMSKKIAEKLLDKSEYVRINPGEFYKAGRYRRFRGSLERPEIPSHVLLGEQGPYWLAERRRWTEGLELEKEDFVEIVSLVDERVQE
jgi:hypothetical protein